MDSSTLKNSSSDGSKGLVSICVPTYNRSSLIRKLLDSILNQSYQNFEIIITDNSDNLDTQKLIFEQFRDSRIRYIKNSSNLGMGRNVQKALGFVSGEFFTFTPDDDVWIDSDKLRSQVSFLERNRNIDIVYSNAKSIDYDGSALEKFASKYQSENGDLFQILSCKELLPGSQTEYFLNILTPVMRVKPLLKIFHQSWYFESEEYFCYYLASKGDVMGFYLVETVALREAEHYRTALEDSKIVDWKKRKDLRIKQIFAIYTSLVYFFPETKVALETSEVNNFLGRHVLLTALSSRSVLLSINTLCACFLFFRKFSFFEAVKARGKKGKTFG